MGNKKKKKVDDTNPVLSNNRSASHEYHLIRDAKGVDTKRSWIEKFKTDWGEKFEPYLNEISSWPAYIEDEEFFFVHAGLVPGEHPSESDPFLLTNIRTWDGQMLSPIGNISDIGMNAVNTGVSLSPAIAASGTTLYISWDDRSNYDGDNVEDADILYIIRN